MECCQICHCPSKNELCRDCVKLSETSRLVVQALVIQYNPVFRAKIASALLADRDRIIAAILRWS